MNIKKLQLQGFTLIELLVVVVMLAVLTTILLVLLNPFSQLDKAKDTQRKHDFGQIRNALDAYYNDKNCYPLSVPFGSDWVSGSNVYMKNVPQDPDCYKTGYCYIYQTDQTSSCPQWNILWTRLSRPTNAISSCLIRSACGTYPNVKYNYCVLSGRVDCSYVSTNPLPNPVLPTPTPTPTPVQTPTPTPTPTPGACSCATAQYDIRAGNCNLVSNPPFNYCDSNCTVPCVP